MQDTAARLDAPPEPWIGLRDAAHLAGVTESAVFKAGKRRAIRTKQLAGRTLYHRVSVEKYAEKRRTKAA